METGYKGRINYKRQWVTVDIVSIRKDESKKGFYPINFMYNGVEVSAWNNHFEKIWNPNANPAWHSEPATQAQVDKLKRCGVTIPAKLTKKYASDLIEQNQHKDVNSVRCCECGSSVPKSKARWDSGMGGWHCGC